MMESGIEVLPTSVGDHCALPSALDRGSGQDASVRCNFGDDSQKRLWITTQDDLELGFRTLSIESTPILLAPCVGWSTALPNSF